MAICDQLDDYLCDWLSPAADAEFADHLANCETCRTSLELQQWIDRNLVAYRESIPIPDGSVAVRVDLHRDPDSRRNRVSGTMLTAVVAVAAVLLFIGLSVFQAGSLQDERPESNGPIAGEARESTPLASVDSDPVPEEEAVPVVTLQPGADTIAVPLPSTSNRVSVFRVYNVMGNSAD